MHRVGVSVNVIRVTSQGPCGEHAHQCEMFAILSYVVRLVIKPRIFSLVARQPALPHSLRVVLMLEPNMKLIGPSGTDLRHILVVYIMCLCDLDI